MVNVIMQPTVQEVNAVQRAQVPQSSWVVRAYQWSCERLYNELAYSYDMISWLVSFGQWRRWQMGVWRAVRGQRILEVGCGNGAMLVAGARRGLEMVGVDRSPRMLAAAWQRLGIARSQANLTQGNGSVLPFAGQSFDCVIATFPAGYLVRPNTLAEIRRVLKPSGRFVVVGLWVSVSVGRWSPRLPVFYGRPDDAALARLLHSVEAAGFAAQWVAQQHGRFAVGAIVADTVPEQREPGQVDG